jgi:nucleotide-binding universal stress UspA family protein
METRHGTGGGAVVVGFDGSPSAEAALHHGLDEAARRGVGVRVVAAHEPPDTWAVPYGEFSPSESRDARIATQDRTRRRVVEITGSLDVARRSVPVEVVAITGPAAEVLVQEAEGAAVLVIGHRGRGAVRSALLGSVGLSVVLHAPCPVTVVPPPVTSPAESDEDAAAVLGGPLPVGPIA